MSSLSSQRTALFDPLGARQRLDRRLSAGPGLGSRSLAAAAGGPQRPQCRHHGPGGLCPVAPMLGAASEARLGLRPKPLKGHAKGATALAAARAGSKRRRDGGRNDFTGRRSSFQQPFAAGASWSSTWLFPSPFGSALTSTRRHGPVTEAKVDGLGGMATRIILNRFQFGKFDEMLRIVREF